MIESIYILCLIIIIKSEVWTITHCSGLGHETMVSAVCLSVFLRSSTISRIWIQNVLIFGSFIRVIVEYYRIIATKYQFVLGENELDIRIFRYRNMG